MKKQHTAESVPAFPHLGGCEQCRKEARCNVCGCGTAKRCTNGRCMYCHASECTPGGFVAEGHGFGRYGNGE